MPRIPGTPLPCKLCPKIPPGADPRPENAAELTGRALQFYVWYLGCKAVGRFPDDDLVRHLAGVVRAAEDAAARAEVKWMGKALAPLLQAKPKEKT